ncbi:cobyrinate a,c-diamide synthase [Butyrivibrio sp. XPD2002]|uniref:cobyrinate a,c-diamide synthase n=1 Tax=Butyrivibrio sp. XPD2002 TaxID=1280665 RepID=UPI000415D569|nr:cobyrinate a,c-diamide synthase [Butyrivibrio sp. XPD2002]
MNSNKQVPGILIAAPGSGSGKTLITCALLQILKRHGYRPASFKCGPDYIDPMFHKRVLDLPSRNLDVYLAGERGLVSCLEKGMADSDIAVIEGVMGFFDGISATSTKGSSYDIAGITGIPAILVVNARGMSKSIIPLIKGFVDYGDGKRIKGVILNNISAMLAEKIRDDIYEETGAPVIGHLPVMKDVAFESRHLGLVMPNEIADVLDKIERVADEFEKSLDIMQLLDMAKCNLSIDKDSADHDQSDDLLEKTEVFRQTHEPVRVGVAMDEAFCFYYEDNLDLLRELGAEIVPFSPIHDERIPDVSKLILGGGYPELYAKELSENVSMLESIRNAANNGMPILAECGGFLYLQKKMADAGGESYDMAGIFQGEAHMTTSLKHFGYVGVTAEKDNPYLNSGETIRGHEFHYYDTSDNGDICAIKKPVGDRHWQGYRLNENVFGGFAHLYYPSCPEFIFRFLER